MNKEEIKYYHRINNLEIRLEKTKRSKYIMIYQWSADNSSKWGIAVFRYDNDDDYWHLDTFGKFNSKQVDWYDFGCLVNLGYKWIEEDCFKGDSNE